MSVVKSLVKLFEGNKDYNLQIHMDNTGMTVYLDFDPYNDSEENCLIPIRYNIVEDVVFVDYAELKNKYNPVSYGLASEQIDLIQKVMRCLDEHKDKIHSICHSLDGQCRQRSKENAEI